MNMSRSMSWSNVGVWPPYTSSKGVQPVDAQTDALYAKVAAGRYEGQSLPNFVESMVIVLFMKR